MQKEIVLNVNERKVFIFRLFLMDIGPTFLDHSPDLNQLQLLTFSHLNSFDLRLTLTTVIKQANMLLETRIS